MKPTKEECLKAVKHLYFNGSLYGEPKVEMLEQLINEHFELLEKYEKLERENLGLKTTIKNLNEKIGKRYEQL